MKNPGRLARQDQPMPAQSRRDATDFVTTCIEGANGEGTSEHYDMEPLVTELAAVAGSFNLTGVPHEWFWAAVVKHARPVKTLGELQTAAAEHPSAVADHLAVRRVGADEGAVIVRKAAQLDAWRTYLKDRGFQITGTQDRPQRPRILVRIETPARTNARRD
jgi:hypothetical protein